MKAFTKKVAIPLLCLAIGLALFGASYALLGLNQSGGGFTPLQPPRPSAPTQHTDTLTDGDKLFTAIIFDDDQRLRHLLEGGADPNSLTASGFLPLGIAVSRSQISPTAYGKVQLLIQHGANPNQPNTMGKSPMHAAAQDGTEAIMTQLLNAGGDANLSTSTKTPYETALSKGNTGALAAIKTALPDHVPADSHRWKAYRILGVINRGMKEARRHTGNARANRVNKILNDMVLEGLISKQDAKIVYQKLGNAQTGP